MAASGTSRPASGRGWGLRRWTAGPFAGPFAGSAAARVTTLAFVLAAALPAQVAAQAPLSAIDWLSDTIGARTIEPAAEPAASGQQPAAPDPASDRAVPPEGLGAPEGPATAAPASGPEDSIDTRVLGPASPEAIGLFPAQVAGLAPGFWGRMTRDEVIALISAPRALMLPALTEMQRAILLAELTPPQGADQTPILFLARIDRLLALGALEEAAALIEQARPDVAARPEVFRRAFDAALLLGTENNGCARIERAAELAPTLPVRIFCFVRLNDWQAAQLTLDVARVLGQVAPDEGELLIRFLDPALADEAGVLPRLPEGPMTPLLWRILEAIGEPVPTAGLPLAFAHADLEANAGWRARIAAAERLARAGVIAPDVLFALYAEHRPAASGGLWERAALIQRLEAALARADAAAVVRLLGPLWAEITAAGLEVPFARQYGAALMQIGPDDAETRRIIATIGLLRPEATLGIARPAPVAAGPEGTGAEAGKVQFVQALLAGDPVAPLATDATARAIALAFRSPAPAALLTPDQRRALDEGRAAAALFAAMDRIAAAAAGDTRGLVDALAFLRVVGFERTARQAAVQLMLLDRRG